jgi:ubiquinone/menaquinone biosynthesis C-methylase UbiE
MGISFFLRLANLWKSRKPQYAESPPTLLPVPFFQEHSSLSESAMKVGKDWRGDSRIATEYYKSAERWIDQAWIQTIWPFIQRCDFSCVVDLAAGHGRNTRKLLEVAKKLYVVDINMDNIRFCQQRFAEAKNVAYIQNDGFTLREISNEEVTLVYCFDAMVHFDSDVVRSYLHDFFRVLTPGGYGFCHYSNYDKNPGGSIYDNPGWKNFMSEKLFHHYCTKEGFEVVQSLVFDNGTTVQEDCVTLFRKPLPADAIPE